MENDKTVISLKELLARWNVSRGSITKMEHAGELKRLKIPEIYYSMKNVLEIEGFDEKDLTHSPFEWRRMTRELEQTKEELHQYKSFFRQLTANIAELNYKYSQDAKKG